MLARAPGMRGTISPLRQDVTVEFLADEPIDIPLNHRHLTRVSDVKLEVERYRGHPMFLQQMLVGGREAEDEDFVTAASSPLLCVLETLTPTKALEWMEADGHYLYHSSEEEPKFHWTDTDVMDDESQVIRQLCVSREVALMYMRRRDRGSKFSPAPALPLALAPFHFLHNLVIENTRMNKQPDLSTFSCLTDFRAARNHLTAFDQHKLPVGLEMLDVSHNEIPQLILNNPRFALKELRVDWNPLRLLSVCGLREIERIVADHALDWEDSGNHALKLQSLPKLRYVVLDSNKLTTDKANDKSIWDIEALVEVNLCHNHLTTFPSHLTGEKVQVLQLSRNFIEGAMPPLKSMMNLITLMLDNNKITQLPELQFPFLHQIDVSDNALTCLPSVEHLVYLRRFMCMRNQITELPKMPLSLEVLQASMNNLRALPHNLDTLHNLETLCCRRNFIEKIHLPCAPRLTWLDVSGNHMREIDASSLERLEVFHAAANLLSSPPEISPTAKNTLDYVDLTDNPLEEVPFGLLTPPTSLRSVTLPRVLRPVSGSREEAFLAVYTPAYVDFA